MLVPHAAVAGLLLALPFSVSSSASAGSLLEEGAAESTEADVQFDLETIFDEKGLFGPSARSAAFSSDGRYAAYLWRPYAERRHGNDLYLVDVQSGEVRRLTSVSVLAPFQEDTAKVGRDRIKKAGAGEAEAADEGEDAGVKDAGEASTDDEPPKKAGSWSELKDKAESGADSGEGEDVRDERMDVVSDDDADDKEAPRYRGISSFVWAPDSPEMLVSTGGDVYRLDVDGDGDLTRLTRTRDSERRVQYLPDGSGYTTLVGDALVRVRFGEHFVEQLDPELPSGMEMRDYRLSPDGESLVFIASEGRSSGGARTVNIATYNDRFMEVRKVPRTVSDDPIRRTKSAVFLYRLPDATAERGRLVKVYTREASGPRDVMRLPDWAPDSSKVAFAVFDQESAQVHVLESGLPEGEAESGDESFETIDARIVHRFLHNGGPTTPRMIAPMYLADSRRIVLLTEQTGFRHPHVLDPTYETLSPLTSGRYEVYPIGMPEDRSRLFVAATKEDSACQDVYSINLEDGAMTRLTRERGQYTGAAVSQDGEHVMATFTAFGAPRELVHVRSKSGDQTALTDSHPEKAKTLTADAPTFFSYDNRHGQTIQGHLFLPEGDRADDDKRPLLIYVYGGPLGTRKQVTEGNFGSDGYFFANYLAKTHGWITCTIDPRGMSGYGALFEKANFERVGLPQVEDLVDGVKFLVENHGVDPDRVGIHGWSFGGFQTQMCLYTEPEVFKCGIAGAGPTEWENYNSWYSTGTIGDSREGKTDLDKYSLLPLAENLEGKLLLVHGMEDANVLYQDTVRVYAELLDAGKETLVELFVDPSGGHGLGGHVKRLARFRKYEEFLLRTLP